jgi:hypothetical protein
VPCDLDVAAELEANLGTFAHYRERALDAGAMIVPAMAFFGGLGGLPTTATMGDWTEADEAHIAYALSDWHPTVGTRLSGAVSRERRGDHRLRYRGGQWEHRTDAAPTLEWTFPEPMGPRPVIGEFTMADVVTVPQHLSIPDVTAYMTAEAARDVAAPHTGPDRRRRERALESDLPRRRRRPLRRSRTPGHSQRPGHLRRHRAPRHRGPRARPDRSHQGRRRRLRRRDLRRPRLPARARPAHHARPAPAEAKRLTETSTRPSGVRQPTVA